MLNPITYTENVARDFLRYQLSAYPLADDRMQEQMRSLLNLDETRKTPLLKGPYVSLSRMFRQGTAVKDLILEGVLHPHMERIVSYSHLYGHQDTAVRSILSGTHTLVSTGTGSGKTESFLYPIISRCLALRDQNTAAGITAVIVYPMNALAEDQLGRLRELLCGTGISFGIYVGSTPERAADVSGIRLPQNASRETYLAALETERQSSEPRAVHPPEERASREEMRASGKQPRILLTNVKQLELLLTRQRDVELFDAARLEFLAVDEAHTFSGAMGAETACLIRRLRAFCGHTPDDTVCIATSATIADPKSGVHAAREFASRFFGIRAENVELVSEEYQEETWADELVPCAPPSGDPLVQLEMVLTILRDADVDSPDDRALSQLKTYLQTLLGARVDMNDWRRSLYDLLGCNETVFHIASELNKPASLKVLCETVAEKLGRNVHEAELLMWLALGAAARKNERPLLRPVVHAFVRGVDGAVVTFPAQVPDPKLWLAAEDAVEEAEELHRLHVMTCTTCGQHYFEHFVADFEFMGASPGGGELLDGMRLWPALESNSEGANRVVLLNRFAFMDEEDETDLGKHNRLSAIFYCRFCGGLHSTSRERCGSCGNSDALIELFAVQQKRDAPGRLSSCVACKQPSRTRHGRHREPARPVKAVNVSDVHVLAQSMLQHAERRRLLIFADNRQDAAFQAGWMQDHARRFRLRAVMDEIIQAGATSPGDLVFALDELLENDEDLSRALIPEVWRVARKERSGNQHQQERKKFLRLQVMRELATGNRQRLGLEPWGRMRVDYASLNPDHVFFKNWAPEFGIEPIELVDGVASMLDVERRKNILWDPETGLYSRYWYENAREVERGYIPLMQSPPKGLKLRRGDNDDKRWVGQFIAQNGQSAPAQAVKKWGLDPERSVSFLEELWRFLTEETAILKQVTLLGGRGEALVGSAGTHQIDSDSLLLVPHTGVWQCRKCRRGYARSAPHSVCMGWHCDGTLEFKPDNDDDYDLTLLKENFVMVRPREHSAQVPAEDREVIERLFKGSGERVNVVVSTPTLELGVDIGALDSVLMRNVPPLPANYWQRAGRAGRRHRMAVNLTYARPASHDRAYFADPLKMLGGLITPPSFNLKNAVMVKKHVHSAVLGLLHKWARSSDLSEFDRAEIKEALGRTFPHQIRGYLFDEQGRVLLSLFDVSPLRTLTSKHLEGLLAHVVEAFAQGWPETDEVVVSEATLRTAISEMPEELESVIRRLDRRLRWALGQLDRLDVRRREQGTLVEEDQELWRRCDKLVKKLKGEVTRRGNQAEGFDDTYTYAVLAAEGYLPGYGLDNGAIAATHIAPENEYRMRDWIIRRAPAMALREYIPGNLIYANGHRFAPRYFQLSPEDPTVFQVDIANEAVVERGAGRPQDAQRVSESHLAAVPVCDVQLPHFASISDDEDYRFQLPSAVYGYELERHEEGRAFDWGRSEILWRRSVHMRLVNVGPSGMVATQQLGFPICTVCGQSRSPFIPDEHLKKFQEAHRERCGQTPYKIGIFADVIADALTFQHVADRKVGHSVLEALRQGASQVLEMEIDDLQLLAMGYAGGTHVDMVLYDPMPGGSGLLEQMLARWPEVIEAAKELLETCASDCGSACVDCLLTYRNAHYHRHLNRHSAIEFFDREGAHIEFKHDIPARLPTESQSGEITNRAEEILAHMMKRAGFPEPIAQKEIDLGHPLGRTFPDFYFDDPNEMFDGICIYLDGQTKYGPDPVQERQRELGIRQELEARGYRVLEIEFSALTDQTAMGRTFQMLARLLMGRDAADRIRGDLSWFEEMAPTAPAAGTDAWVDVAYLIGSEWAPLVSALRNDFPGPQIVGEDIMEGSRATGARVLMAWFNENRRIELRDGGPDSGDALVITPDTDVNGVKDFLRRHLEVE
ncbi:DEAD/DEAH box helicase [Microvenator marinus]|uniref:DEAD/DEAH box helicase n=1 Tax=Microvenator marinus TaxID=2600177 RepID=A0A5B8Y0U6_9DELT|nr:DEAD/DEAH box helicase [Microvenator marinus]QED29963.1 DEAD/DEAH box helicase [Microvenator marinus]